MTDKQIIIDGVDVRGCKNFSCGKCEEENKIPITINHFTADCRMYPNCYYKQLKRKEQECEELKKQHIELYKENNKLKQTLTEIEAIAMGIMDDDLEESSAYYDAKKILQEISECEVGND